jgi:hypothetical protein
MERRVVNSGPARSTAQDLKHSARSAIIADFHKKVKNTIPNQ